MMSDYARMAQVIRYLDAQHHHQPDLAALAGIVGLSPFHFHRLFRQWTGVTPKAFLQCLTLEEVKSAFRQGSSVLDAALDAGLSGPGRLHDLCLKLEAVTPGEIKSQGRSLSLHYGFGDTPLGPCLAAFNARGLCHLSFVTSPSTAIDSVDNLSPTDREEAVARLRRAWPQADLHRDDPQAARYLGAAFHIDPRQPPSLSAWVAGTPFQIRVWQALLTIPSGHLTSYGRLARLVGNPKAARAVGSAVGANPMAVLIPCHRVIRETGAVGHYHWGHGRKRVLIAWERALEAN